MLEVHNVIPEWFWSVFRSFSMLQTPKALPRSRLIAFNSSILDRLFDVWSQCHDAEFYIRRAGMLQKRPDA